MTDDMRAELDLYIKAVLGKKPVDVVALDMRELTSIADAFIICSGSSNRQVTAIAEHVERQLRKQKVKPLGVEGAKDGQWVLLDYGHVIIHVSTTRCGSSTTSKGYGPMRGGSRCRA